MKKKWMTGILAVTLMMGAVSATMAAGGGNIVRQTDIDTGIRLDIVTPADVGEQTALLPITGSGSEFQLWADNNGTLLFVDSKIIGPYMPTATFAVTTEDSVWVGAAMDNVNGSLVPRAVYRTRADRPFTVDVNTSGLVVNPAAPRAAREVNYLRVGENADPVTYLMDQTTNEFSINSLVLTGNTSYASTQFSQLNPVNPSVPGSKVGQEHFLVQAYADPSSGAPSWLVKRATVKVWPAATARFKSTTVAGGTGGAPFQAGQTFTNEIPNIYVEYNDLYPESNTYVRISKQGMAPLGFDSIVDNTRRSYSSSNAYPHNSGSDIIITDAVLQEYVNSWDNGVYTLEVITGDMPFFNGAYESLATISFTIRRNVKIRSQIGTK